MAYWDESDHEAIASAVIREDGVLSISFANGDQVTLASRRVLPPDIEADWSQITIEEHGFHIQMPTRTVPAWYPVPVGDPFEIPWDVIRRITDPEYRAYEVACCTEGAPLTGARVRALRQALGLSAGELARRASISRPRLRRIEAGEPVAPYSMLKHILEAMDCTWEAIADIEAALDAAQPNVANAQVHAPGAA
jgi:DNA-binding transcriptional regulator YiaG